MVPLHSYKFIATLQHTLAGYPGSPQRNPLILRVDSKAGHGGGNLTFSHISKPLSGLQWYSAVLHALELTFDSSDSGFCCEEGQKAVIGCLRRQTHWQGDRGVQRLVRLCCQGYECSVDPAEAHRNNGCSGCRDNGCSGCCNNVCSGCRVMRLLTIKKLVQYIGIVQT